MQPVIAAPPGAVEEDVSQRTLYSKTFRMSDQEFRTIARKRIVHVPGSGANWLSGEDPDWQDLDLDFELEGDTFRVKNAWYNCTISAQQLLWTYVSVVQGHARVELARIGDQDVGDAGLNYNPVIEGNKLTFTRIAPDLDITFVAMPVGLFVYKTLYSVRAPRHFVWDVEWDESEYLKINTRTEGFDNLDRLQRDPGNVGRHMFCRKLEMRHGIEGRAGRSFAHGCTFDERWTGRTYERDEERRLVPGDQVQYPVLIDQDIIQPIVVNTDDGYSSSNYATWFFNINTPFVGWYLPGTSTYLGGWRFPLAVPQGSLITLAELIVNVTGVIGGGNTFDLFAEDVDDAAAFADTTRIPHNIAPITAASTSMAMTATGLLTTDCTNQIQALVSRPGFVSGNNVLLLQRNPATVAGPTAAVYWEDYQDAGTDEPTLEVTFISPTGTNVIPRTMPAGWLGRF